MTGYARAAGTCDGLHWQWEIRSVNGKALDVRLRTPPGYESLEPDVRAAVARQIRRGNVAVSLSVSGTGAGSAVTVNGPALEQVLALAGALHQRIGGEPPRADVLLGLRGIVEVVPAEPDADTLARRNEALLASLGEAIAGLVRMRAEEGARLTAVLQTQLARVAELVEAARVDPSRTPSAIAARLSEQVARLIDTGAAFDRDRLHQEAILLATRIDIQEELDRLASHLAAARLLLKAEEAVGRKFDFLAQEFNREANTLCSKSADRTLTAIGLDLKTVIDQFREQVQNIE